MQDSSHTETRADTDAKYHNSAESGDVSTTDTDHAMGVSPTTQPKTLASQAQAPTPGSSIADRHLILRGDETVQLPNMIDQEIASVSNRALFHQAVRANIRIMNAMRNPMGAITAIMHQNATIEMAMWYCDVIIMAGRTVDRGVVDHEDNTSWEKLIMHAVPLRRDME